MFLFVFTCLLFQVSAQTIVKMEKVHGVYMMPCIVNGLKLNFIFDTGASDISISLTEALFMLKNGYLSEDDLGGTQYYQIANGEIEEGTKVTLRTVEIGNQVLKNVEASVVHHLNAPLLLGQSALEKLGRIEFDYSRNVLTIINGSTKSNSNQSVQAERKPNKGYTSPIRYAEGSDLRDTGEYLYITTFKNPSFEVPLLQKPDVNCRDIVYRCPKQSQVYLIEYSGDNFCKVKVDGNVGYVAKNWVKMR